jgi:phosphoribosylanthranilate isomerase
VIVQVYTMQSVEEALAGVDAGADHVGITPPEGLPGELPSFAAMREIVDAVGERARVVALTVSVDADYAVSMVETVRPAILHLCPLASDTSPAADAALRVRVPGVSIMQAVSVTGPESIAEAQAYAEVADCLILDTQAPDIAGVGASGGSTTGP